MYFHDCGWEGFGIIVLCQETIYTGHMSKTLAALAAGFTRVISLPQTPWRRMGTVLKTAEALKCVYPLKTRYGVIKFDIPNLRTLDTPWNFHKKEPPTIEWVDRIPKPATLWDIGANAGEFSLYAAKRGINKVICFEPSPATYANLCRSKELNNFNDSMQVFCMGLTDVVGPKHFYMVNSDAGHSCHNLDPDYVPNSGHVETILTFTIDTAIDTLGIDPPQYIKIDIDGSEEELIRGGQKTLKSGTVKSIYIEHEGDPDKFDSITNQLADLGFNLKDIYRPTHLDYFFAEYIC
jgi:FkbM family methyltransferase